VILGIEACWLLVLSMLLLPFPPLPACRRDATLQLEDLRKYGLADSEALYQVIYSGKGSMPG
jgi:hypothetical protein